MKVRYKNFEWQVNPSDIEISSSANISVNPVFDHRAAVENVSLNPTVVKGKGDFFGEKAREYCATLNRLLKLTDSDWLYIPDAQPVKAFFKDFSYFHSSKTGGVHYKFTFIEDCSDRDEKRLFDFTYAKADENGFDIAARCGVEVEDIMRLNNIITPFDITEGQKVIVR